MWGAITTVIVQVHEAPITERMYSLVTRRTEYRLQLAANDWNHNRHLLGTRPTFKIIVKGTT